MFVVWFKQKCKYKMVGWLTLPKQNKKNTKISENKYLPEMGNCAPDGTAVLLRNEMYHTSCQKRNEEKKKKKTVLNGRCGTAKISFESLLRKHFILLCRWRFCIAAIFYFALLWQRMRQFFVPTISLLTHAFSKLKSASFIAATFFLLNHPEL